MANELLVKKETESVANVACASDMFLTSAGFELAQRMCKALAASALVPPTYRGNTANCMLALEMANRLNASPLAVMQNMYIVHEKPSWSTQFLIACINKSGRFSAVDYEPIGEVGKDSFGYIAYATELATGKVLKGSPVTIGMAKESGWYSKSGSKWITMPDLMLHYRAATLFARLYAPEIVMGIYTADENEDIKASEEFAKRKANNKPSSVFAPAEEVKVTDVVEEDAVPIDVTVGNEVNG